MTLIRRWRSSAGTLRIAGLLNAASVLCTGGCKYKAVLEHQRHWLTPMHYSTS